MWETRREKEPNNLLCTSESPEFWQMAPPVWMRTRFGPLQLCTWQRNQVSFDLLHLTLFSLIPVFFWHFHNWAEKLHTQSGLIGLNVVVCLCGKSLFSTLTQIPNFAQWRYTNQWSFREVVLLLVENWIPIPRLKSVKYHSPRQFLTVSLKPAIWRRAWRRAQQSASRNVNCRTILSG